MAEGLPHDPAAAELALGLLDGEERGAALRRVLAEPGFAADVAWWRERFSALFDLWPEVPAPLHLADRIAAGLDGAASIGPHIASTGAGRRRVPWPALTAIASAIAACLLFVLLRPARPAPPPVTVAPPARLFVATLGDVKAPVAAVFDPAAGTLRVAAAPAVPAARVAQLWVIGGDGVPHPLGLLSPRATELTPDAPDRTRMVPGATLAISVEPRGGSPTGLPTGPVVATGVIARV